MPDKRENILHESFVVNSKDGRTRREDIKSAIKINPDIDRIYLAMDENGKQMCLDLLEYMAENGYECSVVNKEPVFMRKLSVGWETLKKEQLFENFL